MDFKAIAKTKTNTTTTRVDFPDLTGRTAVNPVDLMTTYPKGVTLTGFGWWKNGGLVPVVIAEDNTVFFWAGKVLKDIIAAWIEEGNGDAVATSDALLKSGGLKVKFNAGKTKNGKPITYVTIV